MYIYSQLEFYPLIHLAFTFIVDISELHSIGVNTIVSGWFLYDES